MSMPKHIRDTLALARDLGVLDARVEQRGRHPHLIGVRPNGTALRYPLAGSPSDGRRGQRNMRADLRRACRSEAGPATQHSAVEGARAGGTPGGTPVPARSPATAYGARSEPQRHAQAEGAGDCRLADYQRDHAG